MKKGIFLSLVFIFCLNIILNAQTKKKTSSIPKQKTQENKEIGSQKFCFDDSYGSTGMKLQITLFDDKTSKLEFLQSGEVKRRGSGKWIERSGEELGSGENSILYLYLSTGTLQFTAMKNSWKRIYMLIDSRDKQYVECF